MLEFTKKEKEELFLNFGRQSPFFPHHCVDVAYVLSKYMKENNIDYEIRVYKKKEYNLNEKDLKHFVIYSDGKIYDFSLCQFYLNHVVNKNVLKTLTDKEFIDIFLYEYQRGEVVFDVDVYEQWFTRIDTSKDYILMLNGMKENTEKFIHSFFKDRKWNAKSKKQLINILSNKDNNILEK